MDSYKYHKKKALTIATIGYKQLLSENHKGIQLLYNKENY